MFETTHEPLSQGRKIPMVVRFEAPGSLLSDDGSTDVGEQIELVHAGPDRPSHVIDLFCIRRLFILLEKIVETSGDTDRHVQVFSGRRAHFQILPSVRVIKKTLRTRDDCFFNLFNSTHCQFLQPPIYAFFFARPDRLSASQSFSVWSAYTMPNSAIASANASPVPM